MNQPIVGYFRDDENHWVAELECGHHQHVRHNPPWTEREWVVTKSGREKYLGFELDCPMCDSGEQPVPITSDADVDRVILRDFDEQDVAVVYDIIDGYGQERWHKEEARVRLAILKLAAGKVSSLRSQLATANIDYRDAIAAAEYPNYMRYVSASGETPRERIREIIDADWRQYRTWLRGQD